jgi:YfiR/HmsC-like
LRGACAIAVGVVLTLALPGSQPAVGQLSLGHLKSLYIERFTRFIEWPAEALPKNARFVLCIQGAGETASDLARVAPSRAFKDRSCEVRRLLPGTDLSACHALYLAGSELPRLPQVIGAISGKPILTVSDTPGFGDRGVLINLFQENRFLRFEINLPAVKRSRLVFSSQLLRLARPVGEGAVP